MQILTNINSHLSPAFAPHFSMLFIFISPQVLPSFPCGFFPDPLVIQVSEFPSFLCHWFLASVYHRDALLSLYWDLHYSLTYSVSWMAFHVHVKQMYILVLLGEVLHMCMFSCISWVLLIPLLPYCFMLYPSVKVSYWIFQLLMYNCHSVFSSVIASCVLVYIFIIISILLSIGHVLSSSNRF